MFTALVVAISINLNAVNRQRGSGCGCTCPPLALRGTGSGRAQSRERRPVVSSCDRRLNPDVSACVRACGSRVPETVPREVPFQACGKSES
eukprot:3348334-Prymnesium_polylepis.1